MIRKILLGREDKKWTIAILLILTGLSLFYLLGYEISKWMAVPLETLTRDTFAMAGVPGYTGIVSNFGVLLWYVSATICLFSVYVGGTQKRNSLSGMLLYAGLFSLVLATDDFLMLHESVFPEVLGISEKVVFGVYGITAIVFLVLYFRVMINSKIWILAAAFLFFALSLGIDTISLFQDEQFWRVVVFENYFKLLGVGSWLVYFAIRAKEFLIAESAGPKME